MRKLLQASDIKRRTVQFLSLVLLGEWAFYGIFRCPFAVPYIGCGECPVVQCPGRKIWMWSWIGIGLSSLLFGRAFCGWICPGGFLAEILALPGNMRIRVRDTWIKILANGKYLMLGLSLWFFCMLNNPRWAIPIRTGDFSICRIDL